MLKYRGARLAALLAVAWMAMWPATVRAADATWDRWVSIPGVVDIDGPRSDGTFLVAGSAALYLVDPTGQVQPFARGAGGYREDPGKQTFLARSPGSHVDTSNCDFGVDETYILRQHAPLGINRISADGEDSGFFTNVTVVSRQTALAFDQYGTFDHRLLFMGVSPNGKSSLVLAVDCTGLGYFVTRSLPVITSEMAVAPPAFGPFAGDLIFTDNSGRVLALSPKGSVRVVSGVVRDEVGPRLNSVGFVPDNFIERGGAAYIADHKTPGSAFPGSDTLLRFDSDRLAAAGVKDGDLLLAQEDGGALFAVRCADTCGAIPLITTDRTIHAQGRIAFAVNPEAISAPSPVAKASRQTLPQGLMDFIGYWGIPAIAFALLVALLAAVSVQAIRRRAR
jgi:hypothetical protein